MQTSHQLENLHQSEIGNHPDNPTLSHDLEPIMSRDIWQALDSGEKGDAQLLIRLNLGRLCYDRSDQRWYVWRGQYWEKCEAIKPFPAVGKVIQRYRDELLLLKAIIIIGEDENDDVSIIKAAKEIEEKLQNRLKDLESRKRKERILHLSTSGDDSLAITGNEWNRNPLLLACNNGVIDLRTGEIRNGDPEDYILGASPVEYKGVNEPAPEWDRFLHQIFNDDAELVQFVQRLFGWAITGNRTERMLPILIGRGSNGKSTIIAAISQVLGPLAGPVPPWGLMKLRDTFLGKDISPDKIALRGQRIIWADGILQNESQLNIAESMMSYLTGGIKEIQFKPSYTLFLITNQVPKILLAEHAPWQKLIYIPFNLSFVGHPRSKSERPGDPYLLEKLSLENSGILAWLVRGCLEYQEKGLNPPESVPQASSEYLRRGDILANY